MRSKLIILLTNSAAGVLVAKILGLAIQIIVILYFTRLMTIDDFGRLTTFIAASSLIGAIFTLGFDKEVVRNTKYRTTHELVRQLMLVAGLSAIVICPIYVTYLDGNSKIAILLWVAASSAGALKIVAGYFRSSRHPIASELTSNMLRGMVTLAVIALVLSATAASNLEYLEAILIYSSSLLIASMFILVVWQTKFHLVTLKLNRSIKKSLVATSPFFLITIATSVNAYADVLIVSYLGEPEDVAVYSVALRIANLLAFGTAAMNVGLGPAISQAFDKGAIHSLKNRLQRQTIAGTIFAVVLGIFFSLFADDILKIFGNSYSDIETMQVLWLLLVAQCVNAAFGPVNQLVMFTKGASTSAVALLISAAVNIALNLIFIPKYGAVGAALSLLISTLVWNVVLTIFIRRKLALAIFFDGRRD